MKKKRIKLKAHYLPWLRTQIEQYEKWGYKLIEVRPASFWRDFTLADDIAIMEKEV